MSSIGFHVQVYGLQKICVKNDWPQQSPDLNIIKHMWLILKGKAVKRFSTNVDDLWSTVKKNETVYPIPP